jgi:hypothetical protein
LKTFALKTLQLFRQKKEYGTQEHHIQKYLRTLNPDVSQKDLEVIAKFLNDHNFTVISLYLTDFASIRQFIK